MEHPELEPRAEHARRVAPAAGALHPGPERTVLVVDDHRLGRRLMARVLEPAGFDIVEAGSLQEAAVALSLCRPVAVVLDRCLPDGDGLELARRLRDDPRVRACAIVVCSASDRGGEREEAIRAGADEYVVKPIDTRRFGAKLAEPVARRQRAGRTASRAR